MEEGARLVEEFLDSWTKAAGTTTDGEDVVMGDPDAVVGNDALELNRLRECYEKYQSRLEANPWCREVMQSL